MRRSVAAVPWFLLSTLIAVAHPARAEVRLTFGLYVSDKPTEMVEKFRPVLTALERSMEARLGEAVSIKMQVARTYEKGIDALVRGAVDFARFGPASYVLAKAGNPGLSILAVESVKGTKIFHGIIAVAAEGPIRTIADLVGKSFAFGSERSTIGRYLSQGLLYRHGIKASDLSAYEYLGRHDKVGTAVARGQFAAGALKEGTFEKLVAKGLPLRAIASFPNVTKPWIARSGLARRLADALRDSLLQMRDKPALKALGKDGFLAGGDADYAIIRDSIAANDLFFK